MGDDDYAESYDDSHGENDEYDDYEEYMKEMESQFDPQEHIDNMGDSGTIDFTNPSYDSEEGGGNHMPHHLR